MRFNRRAKSSVREQISTKLQPENTTEAKVLSLDSASVKAHLDAHGALKKRKAGNRKPCGSWNTKIHALMTGDATPVKFNLSAGNTSDAKECPLLLESIGEHEGTLLLMDRAYEDNKTRAFAENSVLLPSCRRSAVAKSRGTATANCTDSETACVSSAACAPITASSTLCSTHSFVWLVSALFCAA